MMWPLIALLLGYPEAACVVFTGEAALGALVGAGFLVRRRMVPALS